MSERKSKKDVHYCYIAQKIQNNFTKKFVASFLFLNVGIISIYEKLILFREKVHSFKMMKKIKCARKSKKWALSRFLLKFKSSSVNEYTNRAVQPIFKRTKKVAPILG